MNTFHYISLTIMRPDQIVNHRWDGIAPETINENIRIPEPNLSGGAQKLEMFLIRKNYLYKNFNFLEIKRLPSDNSCFYIEIPGEKSLDQSGKLHNCFAVFSIQSGLYDHTGYYEAPMIPEAPLTPITVWNAN